MMKSIKNLLNKLIIYLTTEENESISHGILKAFLEAIVFVITFSIIDILIKFIFPLSIVLYYILISAVVSFLF